MPTRVDADLSRVFRHESGRAVATLVRAFGDIDVAEEAVQEAFVTAMRHWPRTGLPPNPGAWITTTARNKALDRLRRESSRDARHRQAVRLAERDDAVPAEGPVRDDRLRLIFTCCHPALGEPAQIALTLRLLGGLETTEIARAFLVPETTMAQRLVRAKKKIRAATIPYRVPPDHELPGRVQAVLTVLYLIYNEGHRATGGSGALVRDDLCREAVRLARLLAELMPDEPEVIGLLALLLLLDSRRRARTGADGGLVLLADQDRSAWDRGLIEEGRALVRACLRRNQPGPFQIQAAINAVHSDAVRAADTDWTQIVRLYDHLMRLAPSPIVALNRAVAVAEVDGPEVALASVRDLPLDGYGPWHVATGDLLARVGQRDEAAAAFDRAVALSTNDVERTFLTARRDALT